MNPANSYLSHLLKYSNLIVRLIRSEVGGRKFARQFSRLWEKDRDAQWALKARWDEPYDEQLQAALARNEITREEFLQKWNELWGPLSEQDAGFLDMLDQIYSACDSFSDDPLVGVPYDEAGLRLFVARNYSSYLLTLSEKMAASR